VQRVTGIGGLFFRARDPQALARWYAQHLGVTAPPATYEEQPWRQEAGPTIFAAMPMDSDHFGRPGQSWAVNFRVDDLDAMVAQLREAGVDVVVDSGDYPNGRFADLRDLEGNPVQLWEPTRAES
jgi:predicted enzyme related to lactoylglutathione lyase